METKTVTLHEKQYQAFNFSTQYGAAISGVQGGKTFVGAYWAGDRIAEAKGDGLILAPTYKILQQSTLPKFFSEFPHYRKYYKEQKGIIEFPNDTRVYIRSAQEPYSLEGMTLDWVWGDEAGQFSLLVWTILRSRTAIKKGKVFFTTTPYNMGWLYKDFYLPATQGKDADLSVITWASVDNPYFPKEFAEKERTRLRPEEFARRYLGEFTRMQGLVYPLHSWHTISQFDDRADITLGGIDWGFTNPAALIVVKLYDGRFTIVDEWYEVGKTTPEIIEQCVKMQNKWGINRWYADSANPEKIRESTTNTGLYVMPYEKLRDSLTAGIGYIQQLLNENRLLIMNTCKNTLNEFETYHYPEEELNQAKKEDPVPEDNHLMDALRYAVHGYRAANSFLTSTRVSRSPIDTLLNNRTPNNGPNRNQTSFE